MTPDCAIPPVSMGLYEQDFSAFAQALGASFERYGFAVVADHGLPPAMTDAALDRIKTFFALADETKLKYRSPSKGGARGYTPSGVEAAKDADHVDLKAFWHVGRELPPGHPLSRYMPPNLWPAEVPDFQAKVLALYEGLDALGVRLLAAIARYLGLEDRFFDGPVALGNSVLRLLHYPPVPPDAEGVRAGAHEDINVITLLLGAEEAGLEILDRDGRWLAINPPAESVVCNIGDMLQRLTNNRLPSTTHRVVNPAAERRGLARYSTPYFLHFQPEYRIETLAGCIGPDRPNLYPDPITADAYLQQRLREIRLL